MPDEQATRLNDGEGLEIAHPEDFGISRDTEGDVLPLMQRIPGTDMAIRVRPLVGGEAESYEDVLEQPNAPDERVEELFDAHIVEGIGSDGDLSQIPDYLVPGLIQAIKNSSGHEVFRAVEEQQVQENLAAVEALGDGNGQLLEMAMEMGKEELESDGAQSNDNSSD